MSLVDLGIRPPYSRALGLYFQAVFPAAIRAGPQAIMSLDSPMFWLTVKSFSLYNETTSHLPTLLIAESVRIILSASVHILSEYRNFLLPPNMRNNSFFSLDRPTDWVSAEHPKCFFEYAYSHFNLVIPRPRGPSTAAYLSIYPAACNPWASEPRNPWITEPLIVAPIPRPVASAAQLQSVSFHEDKGFLE